MTTWFTSDTHFGHANIIEYCHRPFSDVGEMDGALIANWNAVVGPEDDVWHLGDLAYRGTKSPSSYLARLTGRVHLIHGNHDSEEARTMPGLASSQPYAEITVEGQRLVLFHYGMRVWNRSHHGAISLYGHSHGRLPGDCQSVDVGVDYPAWGMRPITLKEIVRHLRTLPEHVAADHHGQADPGLSPPRRRGR